MKGTDLYSTLAEDIPFGVRTGLCWAGVGAAGVLAGRALTIASFTAINPVGAAIFCGLQPLLMSVSHAVIRHFSGDGDLNSAKFLTEAAVGGLGAYGITARLLHYTLDPMGALITDITAITMVGLVALGINEWHCRHQDPDAVVSLYERSPWYGRGDYIATTIETMEWFFRYVETIDG